MSDSASTASTPEPSEFEQAIYALLWRSGLGPLGREQAEHLTRQIVELVATRLLREGQYAGARAFAGDDFVDGWMHAEDA